MGQSSDICHERWIDFNKNGEKDIYEDPNKNIVQRVDDLVSKIGQVTGSEAKALGYTNIYSPILDIACDQRWGGF
ncbi:hypothetical protein [Fodinibius sp. Rm-B-1B1-1]|uniref:hypothetical protein n=1 Tax=Fodinibius alkaliphilus TaxID=3140241 RepID=UPI00315A7A75